MKVCVNITLLGEENLVPTVRESEAQGKRQDSVEFRRGWSAGDISSLSNGTP